LITLDQIRLVPFCSANREKMTKEVVGELNLCLEKIYFSLKAAGYTVRKLDFWNIDFSAWMSKQFGLYFGKIIFSDGLEIILYPTYGSAMEGGEKDIVYNLEEQLREISRFPFCLRHGLKLIYRGDRGEITWPRLDIAAGFNGMSLYERMGNFEYLGILRMLELPWNSQGLREAVDARVIEWIDVDLSLLLRRGYEFELSIYFVEDGYYCDLHLNKPQSQPMYQLYVLLYKPIGFKTLREAFHFLHEELNSFCKKMGYCDSLN